MCRVKEAAVNVPSYLALLVKGKTGDSFVYNSHMREKCPICKVAGADVKLQLLAPTLRSLDQSKAATTDAL